MLDSRLGRSSKYAQIAPDHVAAVNVPRRSRPPPTDRWDKHRHVGLQRLSWFRDLKSMSRLRILVTGATDGIGAETASILTRQGHDVIVHGRNTAKVQHSRALLERLGGRPLPEPLVGDLADLRAVTAMGQAYLERGEGLDVLLHNAGVFATTLQRSVDGHELSVAVNHLAPFRLTAILLPLLLKAPQGRVVVVSSIAHSRGVVDFNALERKHPGDDYDGYGAYAESKLMNVLFSNELARRLQGTTVTSNSLHPGVVSTKLLKEGFGMRGPDSHEAGAATSVYLATDPGLADVSGGYFVRQRSTAPSQRASNVDDARRLWTISEALTG